MPAGNPGPRSRVRNRSAREPPLQRNSGMYPCAPAAGAGLRPKVWVQEMAFYMPLSTCIMSERDSRVRCAPAQHRPRQRQRERDSRNSAGRAAAFDVRSPIYGELTLCFGRSSSTG